MTRVCVTGGSGGAGDAVIQDLLASGFECRNLDIKAPRVLRCAFLQVDMCDYDAVFKAMAGCEMLVHFAGNPHPDSDHVEGADRFQNNTVAQFNAFSAAMAHGIRKIVWASSETIFGFPFATNTPTHVPLDETATPDPQTSYAISKAASETIAKLMAAQHGASIIGLRLSNVLYDDPEAEPSFQKIPGYWDDLHHRKFNLWGYIDSRDAARAVRLALTSDLTGAEVFNIAAVDTIMRQDSRTLIENVMPGVAMADDMAGRQAMLDCSKAKRMLGWTPEYTWENVLGPSVAHVLEDQALS